MATAKFTGAAPAFLLSRPMRPPILGGQVHRAGDAAATAAPTGSSVLDTMRAECIAGEQIAELRSDLARARAEAKAERKTAEYPRDRLDAANMEIGALRCQQRQGGAP